MRMNIEDFLDIEKKYNLYEQEIDGVQYWTYARFTIWNYRICSSKLRLEAAHKKEKKSITKMMCLMTGMAYNSVVKRKIPKKNVDILFLNHERRMKNQQYYECPYTERLSEHYTNSVTIEKPYEYRHFQPVKTNNLMYADYIAVKANLYYRIHKVLKSREYKRLILLVKEQMNKPIEEMKERYSWEVDEYKIYDFLVEQIFLYKKEYKEYDKLLNRLKPKVVIEVVYFCMQNMIINEIAKKKGILTVELQHGAMYPEHAAYHYAKEAVIRQYPDRMFLFSDFWKRSIQVPIPEKDLVSTGYPLFEEKVNAYRNKTKDDERRTILFVSQGTIGIYLSQLALDVAQLLPAEEYRILYKLHPSEYQTWRESYPCLHTDRIEVIAQTESIYKYFATSDMQIGAYSTAIYEGLGFGLQTLILRVGHYDSMEFLVDEGYAQYVDCAEDVIKLLQEGCRRKIGQNDFWKRNAMQNIKDEIDGLLLKENK